MQDEYSFNLSILKSSAATLFCGTKNQTLKIISIAKQAHPRIYDFREVFYRNKVFQFVTHVAIHKAARNQSIHEKDILPQEIVPKALRLRKNLTKKEFRDT